MLKRLSSEQEGGRRTTATIATLAVYFAVPLCLIVTMGYVVKAQRSSVTRVAYAKPATLDLTRARDKGGFDYPASIALLPDLVVTKNGRQTIHYHAEVATKRGESVGLAWEADVVDDRGALVHPNVTSGTSRQKAGDFVATNDIAPELGDGYYAIRARVAVAPEGEPSTVLEAQQYVQVKNGIWKELTDSQWRSLSRASLAFSRGDIPETEVIHEGASL